MNARIARKITRPSARPRYSGEQYDRAERVLVRLYRREDRSRDVNLYYESRVGTLDGHTEIYHVRVCLDCRHLECPCCDDWCDDLDCLDRDHDRCRYALLCKREPIRREAS